MMKIKPHFLTTYYKLPSSVWILAIPTVRIVISLLFRYTIIEYLEQLWIDILFLTSVFLFAYFRYRFFDIEIENGKMTINSGIFLRRCAVIRLSEIEYVVQSKNPITAIYKTSRLKFYINAPLRGKPILDIIAKDSEIEKLPIKIPKGEKYQSRMSDLVRYSIIETNPLTGIFLAYSVISVVSDIIGTDYSGYFAEGVNIFASVIAIAIPPFVAVILSIIAFGYLVSLISFLNSLYNFRERKDGIILKFKHGFIWENIATTSEDAIVGESGKCGFFGALFSVWGDGYSLRTTKKRLLKIDSTPPPTNGKRPSLWGSYLYLRAPLILMGVIIVCYLFLHFFAISLSQIENILFILSVFSIYFLAERILLFLKSRLVIKEDEVVVVSGRWLSFDYRKIEKKHIYRIKEGSSPFMRQKSFYNYEIYSDGAKPVFLYAVPKDKKD